MKHFVSLTNLMNRVPPLWLGLALMLWALLMLGVLLAALTASPASQPAKVAAVKGTTLPPVSVRPPAPAPPPVERVTFRERWSPVSLPAMPAATVTPVPLVAPPPMRPVVEPVALLPQPEIEPGTPVRIIPRKVERKGGTCERHGLRKVWISDRRWRCRR